jgi:hypothetical protein
MGRLATLSACVLAALPLAACSPFGGGAYQCTSNAECGGNGVCDPSGYCAFPDNACPSGFSFGELSGPRSGQCTGGGGGSDADVEIDAPDAFTGDGSACYGTGLVRACFDAPPTGNQTLNATINTTSSTLCDTDPRNAAWCVIAGATISVQGTVTATGTKPLVLVSTGTITVSGVLDVASHRAVGSVGAGANPTACLAGTAPTMNSGGAGGSFGGTGGTGAATGGGAGGVAAAAMTSPTALRGGCPGQKGGSTGGGNGGNGGGATFLIASSISVIGSINASGSGGINANANSSSGGGGGGAGGYIGLEAQTVTIAGQVFANGGGGGEASGTSSTGVPGGDSPDALTPGAGGAGGSDFATNGGNGSQGATLDGAPGAANCTGMCTTPNSGGGGGGGAGIIKVIPAQTTGGTVSPPAT